MLKLRAGELTLLGLTDRELSALTRRKPILFEGDEIGLEGQRMALFHAPNEAALVERLREFGLKVKALDQKALVEHGRLELQVMVTADDVHRTMWRLAKLASGIEPIKETPCPYCGQVGTDATAHRGAPSPGEWALCVGCAGALVLDEQLRLRKPTDAEWAALSAKRRAELDEVQGALRSAILAGPNTEVPKA